VTEAGFGRGLERDGFDDQARRIGNLKPPILPFTRTAGNFLRELRNSLHGGLRGGMSAGHKDPDFIAEDFIAIGQIEIVKHRTPSPGWVQSAWP